MTVAELTFMLERLAEAGCTAEQLVAAAKAARDWKVERKALLAVKRALFPRETRSQAEQVSAGDDGADVAAFAADAGDDGRIETANAASNAATDDAKRTIARAREAVERAAALSAVESRVLLGIISHFNRASGRCDPGMETLGRAANTSERTARRVVKRVAAMGLVSVLPHRGARHANAYRPNWAALLALAPVPRPERDVAAGARVAALDQRGQIDAANADSGGRRTPEENLIQSGGVGHRRRAAARAGPEPGRKPFQTSMLLSLAGGREAAAQRWERDVIGKYGSGSPEVVAAYGLDAETGALTEAEGKQRKGGLHALEAMLRERGPPKAAGAG